MIINLGAFPSALSFWLLWQVPNGNEASLFAYYMIICLLWSFTYTCVSVPYAAITPDLTEDYDERTSLTMYRYVQKKIPNYQ